MVVSIEELAAVLTALQELVGLLLKIVGIVSAWVSAHARAGA